MKNLHISDPILEKPDIILVEDNNDDAELVTAIFENHHIGNSILRLRNGDDAINYFLGSHPNAIEDNLPKIILLDYKLPGMDGLALLKRLRANGKTRKVPVVLLTGHEKETTALQSYQLGISSIITKRSSYEALEKALVEVQIYLNHFKILIVDDNFIDAVMIQNELYNSKIHFDSKIVSNEIEYLEALHNYKPDIIYCDYDLQKYDAIRAVRVLKAMNLNIPFIMVTGQLSEDFASGCMSEGISDYLLKSNLSRLPSSLVIALRKKKIEDENILMHQRLEEAARSLDLLFNNVKEVLFSADWIHKKVLHISNACFTVFGYHPQKFYDDASFYLQIAHPGDLEIIADFTEKFSAGEITTAEYRIICADKSIKWVSTKVVPTTDDSGQVIRLDGFGIDITERKLAEQKIWQYTNALEKRENFYKKLIEKSSDMKLLISEAGIMTFGSESVTNVLGYPENEYIGKSVFKFIDRKYLNKIQKLIQKLKKFPGDYFSIEIPVRHKSGSSFTCECHIANWLHNKDIKAYLVNFRDITQKKLSERQINLLNTALKQSPVSVVITDIKGDILYVNPKFLSVSGYTQEEMIGKNPRILKSGFTSDEEYKNLWADISAGKKWEGELYNRKKNGEFYWESAIITPVLNEDGEILNFLAIKTDITERKKLEAEKIIIVEDIVKRNKDLEQFTYIVSHNLRGPVANLLGLSEIISKENLEEDEKKELVNQISKAAGKLDSVILDLNDILKLRNISADEAEPVKFTQIISSIKSELAKIITDENVYILEDFTDCQELLCNKNYLHSIFHNLITNSIKYRQKNISPVINISSRTKNNVIQLIFKDNGIGINLEKHKDHVFELYKRVSYDSEGKGMGLYLVKTQVEAMGGKIFLHSEINKGCEFILEFKI